MIALPQLLVDVSFSLVDLGLASSSTSPALFFGVELSYADSSSWRLENGVLLSS